MLNKYDFKYILKRVIVFFTIGLIMSIIGSFKVRALDLVETAPMCSGSFCYVDLVPGSSSVSAGFGTPYFSGYGKGFLEFTIGYGMSSTNNTSRYIYDITLTSSDNSHKFNCELAPNTTYLDSNKTQVVGVVKCPVDFSSSGVGSLTFNANLYDLNGQGLVIYYSKYMTFYRDGFNVSPIVNAINDMSANNMLYLTYVINNSNTNFDRLDNSQITIYNKINEMNNNLLSLIDILNTNNQNIEDIKNDIQSDNIDESAVTDNSQGWEQQTNYVPTGGSGGSITDLLTLPIKLIQGFVNGLNSSCVPFNLGNLYGTDLILPCINISSFIGMPLWTTIDILFSGFMILHIGKKFVKIFNDFTNLRSNQMDDLYGGGN